MPPSWIVNMKNKEKAKVLLALFVVGMHANLEDDFI